MVLFVKNLCRRWQLYKGKFKSLNNFCFRNREGRNSKENEGTLNALMATLCDPKSQLLIRMSDLGKIVTR